MNIVYVSGHVYNVNSWSLAMDILKKDGISLRMFMQRQNAMEALEYLNLNDVDIFAGHLCHDLPCFAELIDASAKARFRIGGGWDMPAGFSNFDREQVNVFESYAGATVNNYCNSLRYLASCAGMETVYGRPEEVRTHGIYHPRAMDTFDNTEQYIAWFDKLCFPVAGRTPVGIICYHGQIGEKNCADVDAVIEGLENNGFLPVCVFSEGVADSAVPIRKRYSWLQYFKDLKDKPGLLLNMFGGRFLSTPEDASVLEELNIPVIQLMRLWSQTEQEWRDDFGGMGAGSQSMVFSLAQPEMSGVIDPSLVSASTPEVDPVTGIEFRRYTPVRERVEHLCRRLARLVRLQHTPNAEKRLTIVLNNNPCKGVEATLGQAVGLDTFKSLVLFMHALKDAGYMVTGIPGSGEALLKLILDRKAISEFRWTTTDEIVRKGGVLHKTGRAEYESYLEGIDERARNRVFADWGEFPGEGMVYREQGEDVLLVTGLKFGNLQIIIQPKRGCYGAKCNGEVCRILHEPDISPPPHWLATYKYIRDTSDAVVHFGTFGALEFLPGKRAALSGACFPDISLGDLPNVYLYAMDVPSAGLVAKRRARSVMVDHLTPVQRPAVLGQDTEELEQLVLEYQKAADAIESKRRELIVNRMLLLMKQLKFVEESYDGADFDETAALVSRQIARCKRALAPLGMHVLGAAPDTDGVATMLSTILTRKSEGRPDISEIATWAKDAGSDEYEGARSVVRSFLQGRDVPAGLSAAEALRDWCLETGKNVAMCTREIPQLIRALNGEYIETGLSASLYMGKTQTLPTGRNFYTSDVLSMPTESAWDAGRELADNLLRKYMQDEGRFPESVGVSLWSIDAFHSDGEVFCQILYLMGMKPLWSSTGRVTGIAKIELDHLRIDLEGESRHRPRVDVVIQTSGILRDMVPHFADLVDEAAVMADDLDEPSELNFIRKHTLERMEGLRKELAEKLPESELRRMASFRVFSSAPGTYGTGVGLAIDASAWEDEQDLAETYVNWAGYAYGSSKGTPFAGVSGAEMHKIYAANLKTVDVTYMRQYSPEHDLVDCGCYTGYLGGMAVASKAISGKKSRLYWADVNNAGDLSVRDLKDDINAAVRVKLFNATWIEHQKQHGYKGASGVSSRVNNLFKWSATTQEVEKWVFDGVVETYIRNEENLKWLRENNPYALEEITRRLLEAQTRKLWDADEDYLKDVQDAALMIEGDMEDIMGDVQEEFQGGKVDVLTSRDVEKWDYKWKIAAQA